ncbi:glycosyl transferase [Streptomyces sp. NPDC079167]|uniref:glycosyl transferase n=1 Tax=Streptomyces sp. NPDC079167 TaxID=3154513 RepID=UPI00341C1302
MPSERRDQGAGGSLPACPLAEPATPYRVRYRGLPRTGWHRIRAVLPSALAPVSAGLVLLFLVLPAHRAARGSDEAWPGLADAVTVAALGLVAVLAPVGLALAVHAVAVARDPVPVTPEPGTRVAFLTTYVPGREPLSAVRAGLEGAARMRHPGPLDLWLLDEGDDPEARMLCAELGVHHFTRLGVPEWNQEAGPHQAGTEHGNLNAWIAKHGDGYDLLASVDTGHVPLPGFLERTTGYFRDPDTAFVVGPRLAGGQDFHALAQSAGNRYGAPVLAGPGSVVRVTALRQAGGFQGSGTEDTATGLEIHRRLNPGTGQYWRSVHTPDAPACREGHATPADRHGRRPDRPRAELLREYGKALFRVPPGRLVGYTLLLVHHPLATAAGLLGALGCLAATVHAPARGWAVLALLIALAPLAARAFTLLRERAYGEGAPDRPRATGAGQETEPALATAAGTPAAGA